MAKELENVLNICAMFDQEVDKLSSFLNNCGSKKLRTVVECMVIFRALKGLIARRSQVMEDPYVLFMEFYYWQVKQFTKLPLHHIYYLREKMLREFWRLYDEYYEV
jgi:hypothetical protein